MPSQSQRIWLGSMPKLLSSSSDYRGRRPRIGCHDGCDSPPPPWTCDVDSRPFSLLQPPFWSEGHHAEDVGRISGETSLVRGTSINP